MSELLDQLSVLDELLRLLSSVLIGNHERWQRVQLMDEVGGVKAKLEEMLTLSEKEKVSRCVTSQVSSKAGLRSAVTEFPVSQREIVRQLRASLTDDELQSLNAREELRQQTLHAAICHAHLQLEVQSG